MRLYLYSNEFIYFDLQRMRKIEIIHGPNLNLLGKREPEIYGDKGFDEHLNALKAKFENIDFSFFQSNVEGELINRLHYCTADGIILNAGGYAHTSVALADAVAGIAIPVINVHISNIYQREPERHTELLSKYCLGGIYGMGFEAYHFASQYLQTKLK